MMQLLANVPWEGNEWWLAQVLTLMWDPKRNSWLPISTWPSSKYCRHMEIEPAIQSFSISLTPSLSVLWLWNKDKLKKKNVFPLLLSIQNKIPNTLIYVLSSHKNFNWISFSLPNAKQAVKNQWPEIHIPYKEIPCLPILVCVVDKCLGGLVYLVIHFHILMFFCEWTSLFKTYCVKGYLVFPNANKLIHLLWRKYMYFCKFYSGTCYSIVSMNSMTIHQ